MAPWRVKCYYNRPSLSTNIIEIYIFTVIMMLSINPWLWSFYNRNIRVFEDGIKMYPEEYCKVEVPNTANSLSWNSISDSDDVTRFNLADNFVNAPFATCYFIHYINGIIFHVNIVVKNHIFSSNFKGTDQINWPGTYI